METSDINQNRNSIRIQIHKSTVSTDAFVKTCYWFSRDFVCQVEDSEADHVTVVLVPKSSEYPGSDVRANFLCMVADFALRERIDTQTSSIRELLLAKAFSEAGVLEDNPEGVFGDRIEEEKSDGMFKILRNR